MKLVRLAHCRIAPAVDDTVCCSPVTHPDDKGFPSGGVDVERRIVEQHRPRPCSRSGRSPVSAAWPPERVAPRRQSAGRGVPTT
eukprot:245245-Prymnesium_polylepis.1